MGAKNLNWWVSYHILGSHVNPKEAFSQRYPKGCPNCGGPKRFIVFTELVKRPKGIAAIHPIAAITAMAGREGAHFAECQACHESWVWQEASESWINTNEVLRGKKARGVTGRRESEEDKIGKIY